MSVKQVKDVEVKCPNNHTVRISKDDFEYNIVEVEDKAMGPDTHHRYSAEGCRCPNCDAEFDASVDVWEYPVGAIETTGRSENVVSDVGDSFVAALD